MSELCQGKFWIKVPVAVSPCEYYSGTCLVFAKLCCEMRMQKVANSLIS